MNIGKRIEVNGIVQGVGFRPFIWKIAINHNLKGSVRNSSHGVIIDVYGDKKNIENFISDIYSLKPPPAEITYLKTKNLPFKNLKEFKILKSKKFEDVKTNIPVDLALCKDCEKEIFDLKNRRYLYPFTNCTNCGPRFSIIKQIPYDRPFTTMAEFEMCFLCRKEYEDPKDRRFHAQPNACATCGPKVWVKAGKNIIYENQAIDFVVKKIIDGEIVIIKGLGGFHIACDAFNRKTVKRLRILKNRAYKPFAVMFYDIEHLKRFFSISEKEEELLKSYKAPIVMLKKKDIEDFDLVSPGLNSVGAMLAYTPLHKIIFHKLKEKNFLNPLIMTSGNLRDEPIIKDNEIAEKKLKDFGIILFHNRHIHNRIDDSVCFVDNSGTTRLIRRARGYVPQTIKLSVKISKQVLACGADIKNCFALTRGNEIFLSQHIGDMEQKENLDFYVETIENMKKLLGINPEIIVFDLHPGYYTSKTAQNMSGKKIKVQHHLAHILSVMAENDLKDNVIGISFDGTGYGEDGNIWGGEFFVIKNRKINRVGHFNYFPLPGGDICTFEVWRILLSAFYSAGMDKNVIEKFFKNKIEPEKLNTITRMIETKINSPLTSSAGRIFDAFSALIKGDFYSSYEAQLPMELESMVEKISSEYYDFEILKTGNKYLIDFKKALKECFLDVREEKDKRLMAEKFHAGIARVILEMAEKLSKEYSIRKICLSGGVFQNKVLLNYLSDKFKSQDFDFYFNQKVPANDGGIALGQVYAYALNLIKISE